ncbi:MAG: DNA-3-methyladenine glycosylase [Bacteroidales bacterium]|nr:DNA-3-methyladenine glycosylase [Bacteroidales bacterium]MDT8373360.1 DNA-3-methyladenine glycosylase [Bacteroidales bacterium]
MPVTERSFFLGDAVSVARMLPGRDIVIRAGDHSGRYMITETEAYLGEEDRACHASRGRTRRTEVMYMEGGHLYIYFIYGMYWMMNIVTGKAGDPQAVLIRGVTSVSGPGRVTRALGIDGSYNGEDLTTSARIWLEDTGRRPSLRALPRVGIDYAGEPWVSMPWRFITEDK